MEPGFAGINELKSRFDEKGISLYVLKYSPINHEDFVAKTKSSLELNPDGVLSGALFFKECKRYLQMLEEKSIPFNLINTAVEDSNYHTFVGHNLIQSGRTAAHLFDSILPHNGSLLIVHLEEEFENAFHMQHKEKGFRAYFQEKGNTREIETINLKANESGTDLSQLKAKLNSGVTGIFVTTSQSPPNS
ncbi:MAG: substrate-binding domain-containing protein [Cyclobacteriaceae bacterium]|nr:substrate-binding domain-containing protein [Cyclobacteriaceae bacterium]